MSIAPRRDDEAASLAALASLEILDTPPEAEFDALVAAAAIVCQVPISLVTLLDADRQWFKASVGVDGLSETERDVSFCSHAVLADDLLEVDDAQADPRFAENPFVVGDGGIRFYVGIPLRLSDGPRVGALCVVDRRPRHLDDQQRAVLVQLGAAASRLLEGRRALRLAREAQATAQENARRFRTLSEQAPFGVFHSDVEGRYTYTNPPWHEIYGVGAAHVLGEPWSTGVHPLDLTRAVSDWTRAASAGDTFEGSFRIVRPEGAVRHVRMRARPILDQESRLVGHIGSVEDLSAARQTRAFLDSAGRLAAVGGWEVDLRTRVVTWSDATRQIHEVAAEFVPSMKDARRFFPPAALERIDHAIADAVRHGVAWDMEVPFVTARGRHRWVRILADMVVENGVAVRMIGALQDVSDQRSNLHELRKEQALRVEIEAHARETERLLRERDEMLGVLAHEVRQPLNNASAALQSASAALSEIGETVASTRLARAQAVMGQVLSSLDNNLAVASLLARPEAIERIDTDIDALIAVACADLSRPDRLRVQVVRATATRTARMDMSLMRLALRNLLSNALRHGGTLAPVELRVSDLDEPLALVIDVIDHGPGIDASRRSQLFQRGTHRTGSGQGMGLGLYIVRRVMELHGGQVLLARNGPDGVTMRLVIEQASDD